MEGQVDDDDDDKCKGMISNYFYLRCPSHLSGVARDLANTIQRAKHATRQITGHVTSVGFGPF